MSRVRVVVTIGPKTDNPTALRALRDAGMDVARLNGSHADLAWHAQSIALLREVAPEVPILFDLPGRKVRIGQLEHELAVMAGETVTMASDQWHGSAARPVPITGPDVPSQLRRGDLLLADGGALRLSVMEVSGTQIRCRAETTGTLRAGKGIHIPAATHEGEPLTARDRQMIDFARAHGVDFVGMSFANSAKEIQSVRELIGGSTPRLLAKVETQRAMDNLDEVIAASDAVMIDRGDLSMETRLERVALFQKRILSAAKGAGTPVIVATEMLHSMIEHPYPTQAEVSDITNAVLDGASAIMLSDETAIGNFPTETVAVMRRIADAVSTDLQTVLDQQQPISLESVPQAMRDAIVLLCRRSPVTKIVAITMSGYAARMVAACMPRQPILAVSHDRATARSLNLLAGTEGIYVDIPFSRTSTDHIARCLKRLWELGKLVDDDLILVTSVGYPKSGNRMNLIQMHNVADLQQSLGWGRSRFPSGASEQMLSRQGV